MELLTVDETARLLKVAPVTVRRYIADGRLPAVRVGHAVRVEKEAINQLVKPVKPRKRTRRRERIPRGKPFTMNDPLWNLVGITSRIEGLDPNRPTDVSSNKHKYLAEAYLAEISRSNEG